MDEPTLIERIERAQNGDLESFGTLIRCYESNIYNLSLLLTHNNVEAEEIAQQVFIKIWKNLNKFSFKSSFNTWVYRLVHNVFYDHVRKKSRLKESQEDFSGLSDCEDSYNQVETQERRKIVGDALRKLPDKFQQVVIMYDFEGLSYNEISRILNEPLGTVKSSLFRARAMLQKELGNFFDGVSV
ncbi:MAG: sigma-70 family RNA polymerase sigma factor [Elusimicrobia bacterium]|nr:sigma-70 family RNA polymerase sigma factor [Elusimicrobiota bacterium]